ncbi:SpaA isopeptide-forming pilin-related protein [Enterococcus durans]|uniref:SpaA isopeptide-forming pilin-related protein n=1 Tax=Enterococcus durans TaxID=53345 RepID=UPI001D0B1B7E|nr:SpaA isopeptide-forming pilin-related protein [Enterococcus durans]MCB8504589.1 LPXTG cell wall anchor domain-containing protein [Enterococcus durans]MCB8514367.1 LPXTG cell wall anchor domain-containing protein [Enterococcus durans]
MTQQTVKDKIKKVLTGLVLTGQILVSIFSPLLTHADTLFPEKVTIEYDVTNLYTIKGTDVQGKPFTTQTTPLSAVYDGKRQPVFCIDPGIPIHSPVTPGYTSNPLPAIANKDQTKYISTLWKYVGTDSDTQIVAQAMMWQEINGYSITSITRPNGSLLSTYSSIKDAINKQIDAYTKKPSFHNQTVKVILGESVTLTDSANATLVNFDKEKQNTANIDYTRNGNQLVITPKAESNLKGTLELAKSTDTGTPVAYTLQGQQTVMAGAIDAPNQFQIHVEVVKTGEVSILKLDKNTGNVVPNTEFQVDYAGKTQTVKTNNNGVAVVKNIPHKSKVTVTEISVPAPYVLDKNNKKEVVVLAGKTATAEFKNDVAKGKTTLTKADAVTKSIIPLNPSYPMTGAKYGLFKTDGTLVKEFTLDDSLSATVDQLELGVYSWKETQAPVGYTLDPTEHKVDLTYHNQYTPIVVKNATSSDDLIRMNLDGQKLIQNDTNELLKNGVEFTLTNKRTGETHVVVTATIDGKKGYFNFSDLPLDDYVLTETKGVNGYKNIDPIEITHSYDEKAGTFTFTVKDQKNGNLLHEETQSQEELSKGKNVDLGSYTLKDKAVPVEEPKLPKEPSVGISTKAHTGDGKTNTFVWGDDISFYDDVKLTHENIDTGVTRGYETILVAVYPDGKEKDVWTSGIIAYTVTDKEMTETVLAEYDYKSDPKGTHYYFKELGYNKTEKEYVKDTEHNLDGKDKNQALQPGIKEVPTEEKTVDVPKEPTPKETPVSKGTLPQTGEQVRSVLVWVGLALSVGAGSMFYFRKKKQTKNSKTPTE